VLHGRKTTKKKRKNENTLIFFREDPKFLVLEQQNSHLSLYIEYKQKYGSLTHKLCYSDALYLGNTLNKGMLSFDYLLKPRNSDSCSTHKAENHILAS